MSIGKLVLYLVGALLALVVVSTVISAVFAAIALIWFLVRAAVTLLVLGGLGYGAYKLYQLVTGGSSQPSVGTTGHTTTSRPLSTGRYSTGGQSSVDSGGERLDDLKEQYANGEISESEFERRLEQQLDDGPTDSIDRELQRERR
jgi:hypothetical protein